MMHRFRRRGLFKPADKFLILHKERLQKLLQIGIFYFFYINQQFLIHILNRKLTHRKIIGRIKFSLPALPDSLYICLQSALKAGNIPINLYVVQSVKLRNSGTVGIPHLRINGSRFVLQDKVIIRLSVFGHRRLPVFTEINIKYFIPFFILFNIFHSCFAPFCPDYLSPSTAVVSISVYPSGPCRINVIDTVFSGSSKRSVLTRS